MTKKVASIYSINLKHYDLIIDDKWSIKAIFNTISSLLYLKHAQNIISAKLFPINRIAWVENINKNILDAVLKNILKRWSPYILWLNDPDYYWLHNGVNFTYLIIDCDKTILADKKRDIRYEEYFKDNWVFTYSFKGEPKSKVFKNKSAKEIISKLKNL